MILLETAKRREMRRLSVGVRVKGDALEAGDRVGGDGREGNLKENRLFKEHIKKRQ